MATRGLDMVVSGDSEGVSSKGGDAASEGVSRTGADDGMGSVVSAFVSFRFCFGSEKLSLCRFPGKHIAKILKRETTQQCVRR